MTVAGVDGCRAGWIAVVLDEGAARFGIFSAVEEIARLAAERVLIDIPIGLPETGRRGCDLAARKLLGAAASRVFLDARRPLLAFDDYEAANCWAKADGKGISRQLWGILPKIRAVDRFITPERQDTLLEAHPELAFMRLNGGDVLPQKKTPSGQALRRQMIRAAGIAEVDDWLLQLRGRGAGADDLLDACALALAAREPLRVPCAPERDAQRLRMDIWY
jgi:predicted RNase H-like nuclease